MAALRGRFPYCLHSARGQWIIKVEQDSTHQATVQRVVDGLRNAFDALAGFHDFRESMDDDDDGEYFEYTGLYSTKQRGWIDRLLFSIAKPVNDEDSNVVVYIFSYSTNFCPGSCPSIVRLLCCWQRLFSDGGNNARYIRKIARCLTDSGLSMQTV